MFNGLKDLWGDRRGNALAIVGAALPLIMGSAGLACDTIQWTLWKRQLQRAADSAAIAGVHASLQNQTVTEAVAHDLSYNNHTQIALGSGYPQVSYPAATSYFTGAVKVTLKLQKKLPFSSLFLSSPPIVTAEATAALTQDGDYCVISLEHTSATGISATGNATVDLGCGMITNSISPGAAVASGSSMVNASPIAAVGGIAEAGNWAAGTEFLPFSPPQEDPFASVDVTPPGTCRNDPRPGPMDTTVLTPGCYRGLTLKGNVTLQPGEYFVDGGSIDVNSQANVSGSGVTLILSNSSTGSTARIGDITLNGGATLNLTAPSSGNYKGILVYQDRRAQEPGRSKINGNSSSVLQGAIYFPRQEIDFQGSAGINTNCLQLVARRVTFSGNAVIMNNCPANSGAASFSGRRVRLVA